jgi:hypothetical protein
MDRGIPPRTRQSVGSFPGFTDGQKVYYSDNAGDTWTNYS